MEIQYLTSQQVARFSFLAPIWHPSVSGSFAEGSFDSRQFIVAECRGGELRPKYFYSHKNGLIAGLERHGVQPTREALTVLGALPASFHAFYILTTGELPAALEAIFAEPRTALTAKRDEGRRRFRTA